MAGSERLQRQIECLLDQAEDAAVHGSWVELHQFASHVLTFGGYS